MKKYNFVTPELRNEIIELHNMGLATHIIHQNIDGIVSRRSIFRVIQENSATNTETISLTNKRRIERLEVYLHNKYPKDLTTKQLCEELGFTSGGQLSQVLYTKQLPDMTKASLAKYIVLYDTEA